MLIMLRKHKHETPIIDPETATPHEYAVLFAGAHRREKEQRLQSAGWIARQAFVAYETIRPKAERGKPVPLSLRKGDEGRLMLAPFDGEGMPFLTVTPRPTPAPITRNETVATLDERYRLDFRGSSSAHLGVDEKKGALRFSLETVGVDQYDTRVLTPAEVKHGASELTGLIYLLAQAELSPELKDRVA